MKEVIVTNTEQIFPVKKDEKTWLRLFNRDYTINDKKKSWQFISRHEMPSTKPTAIIIAPCYGDKFVVTREFRIALNAWEWGFPAGLIENSNDIESEIARELKEETGLDLKSIYSISPPLVSSAGLSDETVLIAIVECSGNVSSEHLEETECIETHVVDHDELLKILNMKDVLFSAKFFLTSQLLLCGKRNMI